MLAAVSRESWTDFNAHDPGISLLELLAWLAIALFLGWRLLTELRRRPRRN